MKNEYIFTAYDNYVNVHLGKKFIARFMVSEDGYAMICNPQWGEIVVCSDMTPTHPVANPDIHVSVIREEESEDMALPAWHRVKVSPVPTTPVRTVHRPGGPAVQSTEVEAILHEIAMSYVREPNQSKARTSAISHEIAAKLDIPVMSIAGVRASLSKGNYTYTLNEMVASLKKRA